MKIIEYQVQRFDMRMNDYQDKERIVKQQTDPKKRKQLEAELDKDLKKFNKLIFKQDKLFFVCFNLLLNLANDFRIEKKMVKRNIVAYLVRMMERNSGDLLVACLYFLKKLSIISENKDQMVQEGIIDRMPRFFK
eukprot:CAMPEP_0114578288 /NCGR_PEP_ID=MMETSP0125-20121206/2849_1 /TAXON_ID=485358 ORGANISM="Aristerostoma sp., Strain ATCC 50986" /NCGR_SAMPLE_ID=MMETSP0125 /ASSEMBLY_ACC=CAM_ASM_000245 /LENGTH=134 /DNA_ID=CAMNT_0001768251 /DNA_START=221 /DNA_END=625 /DNA_ORIENTATION=-